MGAIKNFFGNFYYDTVDTLYWLSGSSYMYQLLYKRKWKGSREHSRTMANKSWYSLPPSEGDASRLVGAAGVLLYVYGAKVLKPKGSIKVPAKAAIPSSTIQGPLGIISRKKLLEAMNAPGTKIPLVTKLNQAPQVGRALSTAYGHGASNLANAARSTGKIYKAQIPNSLIILLEKVGLVQKITLQMGNKTGIEYRFLPAASEFIVPFFK